MSIYIPAGKGLDFSYNAICVGNEVLESRYYLVGPYPYVLLRCSLRTVKEIQPLLLD